MGLEVLLVNLETNLESFAEQVLQNYQTPKIDRKKIIRDAVFGSHELSPLEVSIIDNPFVQRLRGISQTALTCLTYPSANHNRFEHSLGVSILAYKMGKALKDNGNSIGDSSIKELRLAGLLHDIGHGPFSHASEAIISNLKEVVDIFSKDGRFSKYKPHEMLTYKLLKTKSFNDFFKDLLKKYDEPNISLDNIASMIIGVIDEKQQYKADIINGAFDADKLDYLTRDAHFTGIKMAVDIERILATQIIDQRAGEPKRIIIDLGGVHILEQILFNKMLLYPSVYHHHKVRSTVCMLKSIFEIIKENNLSINGFKFNTVSDFLSVDDHFFLNQWGKPVKVKDQINKIKNRNLLKRAIVISKKTVDLNVQEILKIIDRPNKLRLLAKIIAQDNELKDKCDDSDIWIDLPEIPRFPEPSQCLVRLTDEDYLNLDDFFPVAGWSDSYSENKWQGYVFGPPHLQNKVATVAKDVLKDTMDIKFNDHAIILAKHAFDIA